MNILKNEQYSIGSKSRIFLNRLLATGIEIIENKDVVAILGVSRKRGYQLLSYWYQRGWLNRIKRGVYLPIPIEAELRLKVVEDAWVLADRLYEPCYIGAWSAAQYWDLTEQIFQTTVVFSAKHVRKSKEKIQNAEYLIKRLDQAKIFGTKKIWRDKVKIQISDPSRTIIDMLNSPSDLGGIRFIMDIIWEYFRSDHKNVKKLKYYANQVGNRTVFKRLGFILEKLLPREKWLIQQCLKEVSKGNTQLDPSIKGSYLSTKWKLWYPGGVFEDLGLA